METQFQEQTYAYRVNEIFKRVKKDLGEEKAKKFNEIIRGASLIDEELALLSQTENYTDEELAEQVGMGILQGDDLMKKYDSDTVYAAFEKIAEIGKSKVYVWDNGEYRECQISETGKKLLPWAGVIKIGGPRPCYEGNEIIARGSIDIHRSYITINGHSFPEIPEQEKLAA